MSKAVVVSLNLSESRTREACHVHASNFLKIAKSQALSASKGGRGMSIWGRLSGATSGLAEGAHMGGPVRGLLGALAGHIVHHDSSNNAQHQIAFTIGVIALGAKMAKADGVVTRDEIIAFKEVFKGPKGRCRMCRASLISPSKTSWATRLMPINLHRC